MHWGGISHLMKGFIIYYFKGVRVTYKHIKQ